MTVWMFSVRFSAGYPDTDNDHKHKPGSSRSDGASGSDHLDRSEGRHVLVYQNGRKAVLLTSLWHLQLGYTDF